MSAGQGRQLDHSQLQYRSCELFFSCQIRLFFSVYIFLAHTPVLVTLRQLAGPLMVLQSGKEGVLNQEQLLQGPLQVKDQRSPFCFEFCARHFDIRVVGYWKYTLMPTVRVEVMLGPSKTEPGASLLTCMATQISRSMANSTCNAFIKCMAACPIVKRFFCWNNFTDFEVLSKDFQTL